MREAASGTPENIPSEHLPCATHCNEEGFGTLSRQLGNDAGYRSGKLRFYDAETYALVSMHQAPWPLDRIEVRA